MTVPPPPTIVGVPTKRVRDTSHEEWLHDRRLGIGGSDAAAIMGVNKYRDAFCTYVDKVCEELPDETAKPDFLREAAYWGSVLQATVAEEFCKREGFYLIEPEFTYTSSAYPFMRATMDYLVASDEAWPFCEPSFRAQYPPKILSAEYLRAVYDTNEAPWATAYPGELVLAQGILDIKTCSSYSGRDWETREKKPKASDYVTAQLRHYMATTGLRRSWAAVLIGGQTYRAVEVPFDEEYHEELVREERALWDRIERREPPEPDMRCSDVAEAAERFARTQPTRPRHTATKTLPGWST